jgi:hypothetical protein
MARKLSATGEAPLSLNGLHGKAALTQPANIPEIANLPQLGDQTVTVGTVVHSNGVSYRLGSQGWTPIGGASTTQVSTTAVGGGGGVNPSPSSTVAPYSMTINGILAIGSDLAPREFILTTTTPTVLRADVKQAPVGASLVVNLYNTPAGGSPVLYATFTITTGTTSATAVPSGPYTGGQFWRVDITAVGSTYSGSDLTVTVQ